MATEFSTSGVRATDRLEYWHAFSCRAYSVTRVLNDRSVGFGGRLRITKAGRLDFGDLAIRSPTVFTVNRTVEEIRRDSCDDYVCVLTLRGRTTFAQDDGRAILRKGDMILYDQSRPFEVSMAEDWRALTINIPRPMLARRLPDTRRFTGRPVGVASRFGRIAGTVLQNGARLEEGMGDRMLARFGLAAVDVLALALEAGTAGPEMTAAEAARLDDVKAWLRANLRDTALDLAAISAAFCVSPRTLNRWFVAEGTTPMRWLWRQRLAACYEALAQGTVSSVTEAAMEFGFNDLSHFSRTFRQAYGHAPSSLLR